jgi:L-ascorbate metabolism protein UlaG (beta-lactamase superfamily)
VRGIVAEASTRILKPSHIPEPGAWDPNGITAAWLGHSTVLVNFFGATIITDPVLYNRIGAHTSIGTLGPRRLVASPLKAETLPDVDVVLVSHAHMDHLNPATLRRLPGLPRAVTAHATTDLLRFNSLREPIGLRWGEKTRIKLADGDMEVEAFEVRHWGARWRYDTYRGYNGYIISREGKKIIFGGDTAWSESFRPLRSRGPFELAIMPIGAYDPHTISHCTPEEAVTMANGAGASYLLPIHHKTFRLGCEGTKEPMRRLTAAIEPERIGWKEIGETFRLGRHHANPATT